MTIKFVIIHEMKINSDYFFNNYYGKKFQKIYLIIYIRFDKCYVTLEFILFIFKREKIFF